MPDPSRPDLTALDALPDSAPERELLRAMRRLQRARRLMHHRATAEMELNPTDLKALQLIIAGERADDPLTASALAGALSEDDAMSFVRTRATAMAQAAAATPTGRR